MRIVLILLLLANLALFGVLRLDTPTAGGEPQRLGTQVNADKIRILTPKEVGALTAGKSASADVCVEWGPLSDPERNRAVAELASVGGASLASLRRVEVDGYPVVLNGFATRAAAERRAADVRGRGFPEPVIVESGGTFSLTLGLYRTEQAANGRADFLAQQGVAGARVGARRSGLAQSMLVLRDPPQPVVARLREIAPGFAGTEVRVGACERPS